MERKSKKTRESEHMLSSSSVLSSKRSKKSSLGDLVKKTIGVLKKPFSRSKSKNSEELKSIGNAALKKPKQVRKRESIAVDYDEKNLKLLKVEKLSKKKKSKDLIDDLEDDLLTKQDLDNDSDQVSSMQQINSEVNGFFYTNDKFITRFEDQDILEYIKKFYPIFMKDPQDFLTLKKLILDMLLNVQFIEDLLNYYDIDIYEFFKFLFRMEPDLFRGSFLKRIQKALRYKKYAIKAKKCSHIERRRARLKSLREKRKR